MPLLGKIVVIKRNGGDGTEFPLTASCMFGRKLDCDIRIQLPQVSKEHCKIELNENKELILTNLSSVNPTRINGEVLHQSERLKHGDLITIIDRSFRFEYPPPKTPKKKRLSTTGKDKTPQVSQDQLERQDKTPVPVEKRKSEHLFDTCLKDGSNLPPSVEQAIENAPEDGKLKKDSMSPFCELYEMVKQDLAAKSPWKPGLPNTPLARPQVDHEKRARDEQAAVGTEDTSNLKQVTTSSTKKRRSSKVNSEDKTEPDVAEDMPSVGSSTPTLTEGRTTPVSQKKGTPLKTPQKFSAGEVVQQLLLEPHNENKTPKSPKGRRSGGSRDQSLLSTPKGQTTPHIPLDQTQEPEGQNTDVKPSPRTSPRTNAGKRFQVHDVLCHIKTSTTASEDKDNISVNEECDSNGSHTDLTVPRARRKRVSFGGQLSPELFDKRLPPNSPLRRGATPGRRSLGTFQKSQSLLRRASTIGLMAFRLEKTVPESTKAQNGSAKKASPKRASSAVKTPSPTKRSPITKAKTPSPKQQKSPSGAAKVPSPSSTSATPKTPASARRASNSFNRSSAEGSMTETPRLQGRFSVSRVSTPSPDQRGKAEAEPTLDDVPQDCVTPKIPLRRKSMKSSARKTPRSAVKSALDVMRSRRSGASRANLKVLNSWADIVKFGQIKPQTEVATKKKITKGNLVKKTVPKPKTPARRLKDDVSTGHAASPVSIVVGKAHMRTQQPVGAAPKIVPNIALFKKDMKMDEDLTGVAEIFKTPAHRKCKNAVLINNESAETVLDEVSVMKTPEESGEMIVSPLSVVSAAKSGRYNNEAVTRLLLDNHDCSLVGQKALSQIESIDTHGHEIIPAPEMPPNDQTEEEEAVPETAVKTPKRIAAPSPCLTGVKKLMKTPKQKTEPVEDLRGKLLKTPKQPKLPQEENLEGVKELLKTPKQQGAPAEDMTGVKRVMPTNPVLCAAGLQRLMKTPKEKSEESEDLTGVRELMKTPKIKGEPVEKNTGLKRLLKTPKQNKKEVEEDLTGIQHLMKTPKHRGEAVENVMGVKRLMQTPKEKIEPVEDLTGVKQLMQTPKQKGEPVNKNFGISKLMKTPRQKRAVTEEDFTGLQELVQEPESSSNLTKQENITQPTEEPVSAVETYTAVMLAEDSDEKCDDKENICPVNYMETLADTANAVDSDHSDQATEAEMPQQNLSNQNEKETISAEVISVCSSGEDGKIEELSAETAWTSENTSLTVKATPSSSTAEQEEEVINSSPVNKSQRGGRGRAAQKSKTSKQEMAKAPAVAVRSLIEEEKVSGPSCSSPGRGRRVKKLVEVTESPIRKSSRAKGAKRYFEDEEAKNTAASQAPVNSINTETSDSLPVVTKVKRGRKAKQDDAVIEPIQDVNAVDASLPVAPEELVQAPIEKPGRTKKTANEMESQPQVHEPKPIICKENAVAPEAVELQSSVDPEVPITATRIRKGRTTKKCLKTELTPSTAIMSTHAVVLDEKPMTPVKKPGRGRMAKKVLKDDPKVVTQIVAEANIDRKEEPEAPVAKSGRGRKAKQQKPQIAEEIDDKPAVDTNALVVVTEEHPETVPKPVRGGRRAKQTKAAVSVEAEQNVISVVEQAQVPVVKSVRKRAVVTEETEAQRELPVKRGRRAAVGPAPPVTAMPSSGCKSVIKVKPEVTEDATLTEVKPKKHTRQTTKVCESKTEEDPVTQVSSAENTEVQKVGRGSRSRKEKSSTKNTSNIQINKSATAEEGSAAKSSKTVNCNSDLVASKDIEEFETSADMKESQLKKSKRMNKLPVETAATEIIQPTDQPSKGRRGRGAKKEEEPAVEDPQEETRIKVKPLRRGRAVASIAPKSEASEKKAASSLRKKRNEELEVRDDCVEKEPLPKKRGRVTSSTEAAAEVPVSSKEKRGKAIKTTPEAEPESAPKKNESRPARGQRKTAEEPHPAPAQTQGSVSGSSAGKAGRGVRKAEADVSTEAAPVRRTRRK